MPDPMRDTRAAFDLVRIEPRKDEAVMRIRVTESERLIMLADSLGWPVIKEDYDHDDVLVQDGRESLYWRHERGVITYASDNLGPMPKPFKLEERIRERGAESEDHKDWRRRAGFGDVGG
jgi:hypothetical protein